MSAPKQLHVADLGADVNEVVNSQDQPLFKEAQLNWCKPRLWQKLEAAPVGSEIRPCLYALVRNHGRANKRDIIEYVGLTKNPQTRFRNHSTALKIVAKRGTAHLSLAPIDFIRGRNRIENEKRALEEIEHILIWAIQPRCNVKKNFTLPGMGRDGSNAWHIKNDGYRFSGQLPLEIVFPWMLVRLGRNRSRKVPE